MIKTSFSVALALSMCVSWMAPSLAQTAADDNKDTATQEQPEKPAKTYAIKVKVMSQPDLNKLLAQRLNGDIGFKFKAFSNEFFVRSKLDVGKSIGLMARTPAIAETDLESAFPSTYKPTLKEILDAIAMQTKTHWVYDPKKQVVMSDKPLDKELEGIVDFEFTPAVQSLPFEIKPARGWKAEEHTNWIMYIPPIAPMAMDFHVSGKLSAPDKAQEAALFASAPADAALDSLRRAHPNAAKEDLKRAKVGRYDAYFFESPLPPEGEAKVQWRQWYFMVGNQLCFVISTILKPQDAKLYPEVETMLKTFRTKPVHSK